MTMKNINFLTLLSTVAFLVLGASSGYADEVNLATNSGAGAPIPSQQNQTMNYDSFAPSATHEADDNGRFKDVAPRVQEDPDAGSRILPGEKPVSYFKRDAAPTALPKR